VYRGSETFWDFHCCRNRCKRNSKTPIEGRACGLVDRAGHMREELADRGLKGAESAIANRESGIREVRNS
jgi:hypothetical protein